MTCFPDYPISHIPRLKSLTIEPHSLPSVPTIFATTPLLEVLDVNIPSLVESQLDDALNRDFYFVQGLHLHSHGVTHFPLKILTSLPGFFIPQFSPIHPQRCGTTHVLDFI